MGKAGVFGTLSEEARARGRFTPDGDEVWLSHQQDFGQVFVISLGVSLVAAWYALAVIGVDQAYFPAAAFVGFGILAASLILLCIGTNVPVTHHMTIIASLSAIASGSLLIGVIMGGYIRVRRGTSLAHVLYTWRYPY